jgi:hypothetical protein
VLLGETGVGEKHNETAPSEAVVRSKFSTTWKIEDFHVEGSGIRDITFSGSIREAK